VSAAPVPAPMLMLPMSQAQLEELIDRALARHAERQEAQRRPLTTAEAAEATGRTPAQFRDLTHRYPALAEKAAQGRGRLRMWDRERLLATLAELSPSMRRRRKAGT
jgi:hypothetical protein